MYGLVYVKIFIFYTVAECVHKRFLRVIVAISTRSPVESSDNLTDNDYRRY